MTYDLETSLGRAAFADQIRADVDRASVELFDEPFRSHLGASIVAHPCLWYLWSKFRWLAHEVPRDANGQEDVETHGRMMRLFQRGHREEPFQINILRKAGWEMRPVDNNGKQFRMSWAEGHAGGSLDAEGDGLTYEAFVGLLTFLFEFKTYNDKQFNKLLKAGSVAKAKPQHYGQMCVYGRRRNLKYAIYYAVCKNDDRIYVEVIKIDDALALSLEAKGESVVLSQQQPAKLSNNPSWSDCTYCSERFVCHYGEAVEVNCRSCRHSVVACAGKWNCIHPDHPGEIASNTIPLGCKDHFGIVNQ